MAQYNFDDRSIKWNTLTLPPVGELNHLLFTILSVDEESHIVHVLFKFAANEKIVLHRHMIHNNTFVVQGEHRLYEPDGTLKEIRPTGMYTSTPAGDGFADEDDDAEADDTMAEGVMSAGTLVCNPGNKVRICAFQSVFES